ncbi:hypothetical protein AB0D38_05960 [Streptomyces sp. NPDC048279]|uniref:hypothetical protein n=1 Tax=Streptomyces sp. NPDC048279 TaxID=3154714 RepID=UPI003426364D
MVDPARDVHRAVRCDVTPAPGAVGAAAPGQFDEPALVVGRSHVAGRKSAPGKDELARVLRTGSGGEYLG